MKRILVILGSLSGVLFVYLTANARQNTDTGYETATVVSVQKFQPQSNYLGDNPADAPLQARDYAYDIGIQLDCDIYVGRYHSPISYLPFVFVPHKSVDIRVRKHIMYVALPDNDWDVKMGIVSHYHTKDGSCRSSG